MSSKCEWKDGKFEGCDDLDYRIYNVRRVEIINTGIIQTHDDRYLFCPFCGADIRKPEPELTTEQKTEILTKTFASCGMTAEEYMKGLNRPLEIENPLIVKSGGTWVAHWKGVDLLCVRQAYGGRPMDLMQRDIENGDSIWKPFSEIEKEGLTDEIALLRPMIMIKHLNCLPGNELLRKMTYIDDNTIQCVGVTYIKDKVLYIRLATPHELQEQ